MENDCHRIRISVRFGFAEFREFCGLVAAIELLFLGGNVLGSSAHHWQPASKEEAAVHDNQSRAQQVQTQPRLCYLKILLETGLHLDRRLLAAAPQQIEVVDNAVTLGWETASGIDEQRIQQGRAAFC